MASKGLPVVLAVEIDAAWRPRLPVDLRQLIVDMATNRTWGEERIASELQLKLGIRVSPRTVRRNTPPGSGSKARRGSQAWSSFVRNHARSVLACDFFVTVTATFRLFYIFVVSEVGTRRILHLNVTDHPTAAWTAQQFRMVVSGDQPHRFVLHDHDSIYSEGVDRNGCDSEDMTRSVSSDARDNPTRQALLICRFSCWTLRARKLGIQH